MGSCEKRMKL